MFREGWEGGDTITTTTNSKDIVPPFPLFFASHLTYTPHRHKPWRSIVKVNSVGGRDVWRSYRQPPPLKVPRWSTPCRTEQHLSPPSTLPQSNNKPKTMMDVTFVLEESGVTATVEVPCEADVAAAKEVACTALAVSPASVEMRIGTQVLEGTCRLQDTAFDSGVQVVLALRFADIKCPAEYNVRAEGKLLSRCGTLCIYVYQGNVGGFNTETFSRVFEFDIPDIWSNATAISQCKTRCYLLWRGGLLEIALPGGEVLREVDGTSRAVFVCGGVVVSQERQRWRLCV